MSVANVHLSPMYDGLTIPGTSEDPDKTIGERLQRIWAERGDFSALTAASILAPPKVPDEEAEQDSRPSAEEMRVLQGRLMEQLKYVTRLASRTHGCSAS